MLKKKRERGVTLVTLAITIIVLLILVGVSFQVLTGESGIIKKAFDAKNKNQENQELEKLKLAIVEIMSTEGEVTKFNLASALNISEDRFVGGENQWYYSMGNNKYIITDEGDTIETELNLGDYFDIGTNIVDKTNKLNNTEEILADWRLLYEDNEYIYIILASYMPNSVTYITDNETSIITQLGLSKSGDYSVHSSSGDKLLNGLKNTEIWNNLIPENLIKKGAIVTGGPDLKLWVDSWNMNKSSNDELQVKYTTDKQTYLGEGYLIGKNNNLGTAAVALSTDKGFNNTLYFPYKKQWNQVDNYWITSFSPIKNKYLYQIRCNSYIRGMHWDGDSYSGYTHTSVRPVVKLKKSEISINKSQTKGVYVVE